MATFAHAASATVHDKRGGGASTPSHTCKYSETGSAVTSSSPMQPSQPKRRVSDGMAPSSTARRSYSGYIVTAPAVSPAYICTPPRAPRPY